MEVKESIEETIDNYLDVSKVNIPTIVFTGSDTQLATVFENLNRGGKKLSKYQVFSAQWDKYDIELSTSEYNVKLLEKTIEWYDKLEEERDIEIEEYNAEAMRQERKINIAEMCSALGKLILKEMPVFWSTINDDTANEIGYSTMAIILGIRNKDLSTIISEENRKLITNSVMIETITSNILAIYKDINKLFANRFHTPQNTSEFKHTYSTNFQILSIFGALWNTKYVINKETMSVTVKERYSRPYEELKMNLLKWYIYDLVEGNWSGTGDTKLDDIVIDQNNKYLREIEKDD